MSTESAIRALAALLSGALAWGPIGQQAPTFRSGIDLVRIDVAVLDKSGAPVPSLTADDFQITAGGRDRRVVSVSYVPGGPPRRIADAAVAPGPSSNTRIEAGRTFVLVVDVESMLSGAGKLAMKGVSDYLDRLQPTDRVGLLVLPFGNPSIEPTTERSAIREAVSRLAGTSMRLRNREMTYGEASGISVGDLSALEAYWRRIADQGFAVERLDRTCSPPKTMLDGLTRPPPVCVAEAGRALAEARFKTRSVVARLRALAEAMTPLAGTKAILLASGGLLTDAETVVALSELAAAAERARVTVYAMLVEAMPGDIGDASGQALQSKLIDNRAGLGGLADIAASSRGEAHRVLGESLTALGLIDRELSGYYLVAFERDAGDRDGDRVGIQVRVRRDGVKVRARREFMIFPELPPPGLPADLKTAVGEALGVPGLTGVPIDADFYALPMSESGNDARVVIAIEFGSAPGSLAAVGYQVADSTGKVLADGFDAPPALPFKGTSRSILITTVPAVAGRFVVRAAAIGTDGRRGSLQHLGDVPTWPAGPVRVSDLLFGDTLTGDFRPSAGVTPGEAVALRVVVRDASARFERLRARVVVNSAIDGREIESKDVPLAWTADRVRRFADAELQAQRYAPGDYLVTLTITDDGRVVSERRRTFRR